MKSAILDLIAYMYSLIALVDVLWRVNQRYTFPKIKNVISHVRPCSLTKDIERAFLTLDITELN